MSKELDARLAALIECCDETDRLIIDTRRFADLEDENAKLREQGERLFDKTLELATENVRLQDENARLRSCLSDDAENARMIMAENEKLRGLVRDAWGDGHPDRSCDGCDIRDECHDDVERMRKDGVLRFSRCLFELRIADRMRELGIEVD